MAQQSTFTPRPPDFSKANLDQNPVSTDRLPPQSLEAEMSVLGSILLSSKEGLAICQSKGVTSAYFYDPRHQILYEILAEMVNLPIDFLTVSQRLKDKGLIERIGGPSYLTNVVSFVPTAANLEYYLEIVREKYLLRQVIAAGTEMVQRSFETPDNITEFLGEVERKVLSINQAAVKTKMKPIKETVMKAIEDFEAMFENKGKTIALETGFKKLDELTSGLHKSNMIVLAARPGMGKTALAMNIAEHVAVYLNKPVGIFSLEMSVSELVKRLICSIARISSSDMRLGLVPQEEFEKLTTAGYQLSKAPMYIDDSGGLSITDIQSIARRMHQQYKIELLIIDYLQLLKSNSPKARDNRQNEISEISNGIKALAKELDIPIIVLAQLNRKVEEREGNRPKMADLRESGAIEQDADIVGLINRPEKNESDEDKKADLRGKAFLDIVKHRNGETKLIPLTFLEQFARFENLAPEEVTHYSEESP